MEEGVGEGGRGGASDTWWGMGIRQLGLGLGPGEGGPHPRRWCPGHSLDPRGQRSHRTQWETIPDLDFRAREGARL